jgi:hypothetical protein
MSDMASLTAELNRIDRNPYLQEALEDGRLYLTVADDEQLAAAQARYPTLNVELNRIIPGELAHLFVEQQMEMH